MLKWLQGADVITLLIFKILTITSIYDGKSYLTFAQLPSSLSRQQDYGPPSQTQSGNGNNNGGGGGGGSINTSGNTNVGNGNGGGGGNGGEILVPKSFPLNGQEPTCEELRAMWRFSKRQSRAPEITNEIPTYRDPFAYNIWEPYYATTRSMGGMRLLPRYRDSNRPVYGRIIHREPLMRLAERTKNLETMSRLYNPDNAGIGKGSSVIEPRRRVQFRFSGGTSSKYPYNGNNMNGYNGMINGGVGNGGSGIIGGSITTNTGGSNVNQLTPHYGSFQKLKELIWTERARELAQQRKAEEMAARVAVLKEIANGISHNNGRNTKPTSNLSPIYDENRSPDTLPSSSLSSSNLDQDNHYKSIVTLPGTGTLSSSSSATSKLSGGSGGGGGVSGGGVYLPSVQLPGITTKNSGQQQNNQQQSIMKGGYPIRPSHFRERNRVLFRQAGTPLDYYQREHRSSTTLQQQQQQQQLDNDYQVEQLLLIELSKYLHQQKLKEKQLKQKQELEDQLLLQQYMMMEDQQQQQQQQQQEQQQLEQQMQQFDENDKYYDYQNFMF